MKALIFVGTALVHFAAVAAHAVEPARQGRAPTPIRADPSDARTGAEIVGKLLKPGPSDPDVPLPSPGLSDDTSGNKRGTPPRFTVEKHLKGQFSG